MLDRLGELEVFLAIAEAGSLSQAAIRLRKSLAAVSRILGELEERLGVVLVDRTTRRCVLTAEGRQLAIEAESLLSRYQDMVGATADEVMAPRGTIRLTAPLVFGREYVAPALSSFLATYPLLSAELELADRIIDLRYDGFDLGVRIGAIEDDSLVARRLGHVGRVIVASREYLAAAGTPATPADLVDHEIVQQINNGEVDLWRLVEPDGKRITLRPSSRFLVNSADAAINAAKAGRGLVRVLSYQVSDALACGELVRVLTGFEPPKVPVSLVWPESKKFTRRVRLLSDFLLAELGRLPVLTDVAPRC
ncbi:LysR family transcriptional regulator [Pandoraea anhela]|uniref:Transcriptional regulator n=1 Tax=Pandoraea anhela TaxID=2508295 RepID=A0A5E4WJ60_9BURK|nr:LysR family transcriptional regulator [Pandoraea anhela]VVE23035.1 transcriptional regulator [Pandoraea anhela]